MDEMPNPGLAGDAASGKDAGRPRSLRRIDALLQGEMAGEAAAELRRSLEKDPAAASYLERQSALRSARSLDDLRAALRKRPRRGTLARALSRLSAGGGNAPRGAHRLPRAWMATAVFAGLALGVSLWVRDMHPALAGARRLSPKGLDKPEIALRFRGDDFSPGDLVPARSGDTLSFAYRSGDSLRVQIWYQEEGGAPAPMTGPGGFSLPPATSWEEARRKILLEGSWRRQRIWILMSRMDLDPAAAADAVRSGDGGKDILVAGYRLAAPAGE